ncbi:GLRA3 [Mytilus coruscus]|uniref:GLRA3 n=1 Tax=Mytilus coruscus TaxID=42192 RepID=A0A6J8C7B4_MYTCO|nr:GLRA3 [Mytilus coruscus]
MMVTCIILVVLIACTSPAASLIRDTSDVSKIRKNIMEQIFEKYDPTVPPNFIEEIPVESSIQLYILSIDTINDSSMDFSVSMFIRQRWTDIRLKYNNTIGVSRLELDTKVMKNVWVPDMFITNEKKADIHHVTVPNMLMHIYPNGNILYSMRCDLVDFSDAYTTGNLVYRWHDDPIVYDKYMSLPQFQLDGITTYSCDKVYHGIKHKYTCLKMDIALTRNFGYHLTQIYISSFLIVILSWVSFWINVDATPARISIGILTVLTITTQSSGARESLPKVSYVKAIDIWMAVCLLFVFGALIEFAFVNVLSRVERRRMSSRSKRSNEPNLLSNVKTINRDKMADFILFVKRSLTNREKARIVDKLSRVIFPFVFLTFNIIYWSVYALWEPELR